MPKTIALVLAAGKGTRMKSRIPKVMHKVVGKPMIEHVVEECKKANVSEIYAVVGHKKEEIENYLKDKVRYVHQNEQLGTGHAVMIAREYLPKDDSKVLVLVGDAPLIDQEVLTKLLNEHAQRKNSATVLTARMKNPSGYGRIIKDQNGYLQRIVEQKDATEKERQVNEINSGMYCFHSGDLLEALEGLDNDNAQGEYYLTDVISVMNDSGKQTGTCETDVENIKAVNSRVELAQVEGIMRRRVNEKLMEKGVTIIDPTNTYIHKEVKIGQDTILYPGVVIEGNTVIGSDCEIEGNSIIKNCTIGNGVTIRSSTLEESGIGKNTKVGPYAYIRPNCEIGENVKIGDFVEVKNSIIKDGAKASHLTYIGDGEVGKDVNLGCGVVFVNYDGTNKYQTVVKDGAFVGCNTNLVAPVTVEENAYIAAGSTITEDVPKKSLAIARCRQVVKENYRK